LENAQKCKFEQTLYLNYKLLRCLLLEKVVAVPTIVLKQLLVRDQGVTVAFFESSFLSYHCADNLNHRIQSSKVQCKPNKEAEKEGEEDKS